MNYYKRTNPLNTSEVYIGRTSGSIISRNHRDWSDFHNNKLSKKLTVIYQALYDIKSDFILELLESSDNSEIYSEREQYWMGKVLKEGKTLLNTHIYADSNKGTAIIVHKYALDGTFIETFPSKLNACIICGLNQTNLSNAISGKIKQTGGFMWSADKIDKLTPFDGRLRTTEVHQYKLDGTYVATFPSMESARRAVGLKSGASIYYAATGRKFTAAKFLWSFSKKDNIKI
jgi:hypothetical protein